MAKRRAEDVTSTQPVDPCHYVLYKFSEPVPDWFARDTSWVGMPTTWSLEQRHAAADESRRRDWFHYLDSGGPRERSSFHLKRLSEIADNLRSYLLEHSSEDDSDDPVPPPPKHRNNNETRKRTMTQQFDDAYNEASPQLLELQKMLDISLFQYKRLLKRWCAEHK